MTGTARLPRAWDNPAYRRARRQGPALASLTAPLPLPAPPALDLEPEPEPDGFPDSLPPGWASGPGDPRFPWS